MSVAMDNFLKIADAYISGATFKPGFSPETTTSFRLFNDSKTLTRLRTGSDMMAGRLENATQWFSDNWPPKTKWPKGVHRPLKTVVAVAETETV